MTKFTSRFATKPTIVDAKETKQPRASRKVSPTETNKDAQRVYAERVAQAQDEFLAAHDVPSHKRMLVASVTQLLVFGTSFYWGIQATGWLMAASMIFTGSAFIAFLVALVGAVLTFKAAWNAGFSAATLITEFDFNDLANTGRAIKESATKRVSLVRDWFKPAATEEVAA